MAGPPDAARRAFLRGSAVLAPAAALVATLAQAQEKPPRDDLAESAAAPPPPATKDYRPTFFTPAEWAFVNAACDIIIPHDDTGPGAVELGVPEYIDRQMQTPYAEGAIWYMSGPFLKAAPEFGYQSALTPRQQYRLSIRAIDAHCQAAFNKAFAELPPAQQHDLLSQIDAAKLTAPDIDLHSFFHGFLLKNVMEGYFCDPMYGGNRDMAAWTMIGYPGVRADYRAWVDKPGRYPYGPVSIHGEDSDVTHG
jgi:gluconate 2-dehydrogenase gamma chain